METLKVLPTQLKFITKASLPQALTEAVSCEENRDKHVWRFGKKKKANKKNTQTPKIHMYLGIKLKAAQPNSSGIC